MSDAGFVAVMFALIVLGSIAVLWMAMQNRRLQREFAHRERLAMIERGLIPPPEVDPAAFETRAGLADQPEARGAARSRSAGIIMIGFGLGLTMLISFAAREAEVGIGIGGAFVMLGAAFIFNSIALSRREGFRLPPLPPLPSQSRPVSRSVDPAPRPNGTVDPTRDDTPGGL